MQRYAKTTRITQYALSKHMLILFEYFNNREVVHMNYVYRVMKDGKWVDLSTLPPDEQAAIKKKLTEKIALAIGEAQARRSS